MMRGFGSMRYGSDFRPRSVHTHNGCIRTKINKEINGNIKRNRGKHGDSSNPKGKPIGKASNTIGNPQEKHAN